MSKNNKNTIQISDTFDKILGAERSDTSDVISDKLSDTSDTSSVISDQISINDLNDKNFFIEKINILNEKINNLKNIQEKINNEFKNKLNNLNEQLTKLTFKKIFNK